MVQGADELFAGYMRYLLFYSEYLLKVEMGIEKNNCPDDFNFKDVIQNLHYYQSLISDHLKSDLFASHTKRYFSLVNRSKNINEIFDFSENVQKIIILNFFQIFHLLKQSLFMRK